MKPVVIDVQNLSKRYKLGGDFQLDETLPEMIGQKARNLAMRLLGRTVKKAADKRDFYALNDVSFQISQGDVVGIIGHNGAGKSTLLKILSEITDPTSGQARIRGRVASLLEVGTGFHPELSGRENIFLNGSILGMTRKEIKAKFDEIVSYSGVEQFIDTPVKRYSSGMTVRLAFSIAAHLDPEILIIDEVLAVGDVEFQNRCLGRMQEVADSGRTVLFVSHNMAAVQALCKRAIMLEHGQIVADDVPDKVIPMYLQAQGEKEQDLANYQDRSGNGNARITRCRITHVDGNDVQVNEPWQIEVDYLSHVENPRLDFQFYLSTVNTPRVTFLSTSMLIDSPKNWPQSGTIVIKPNEVCNLWPGAYSITMGLHCDGTVSDYIKDAARFNVVLGDQQIFSSMGRRPGTILLPANVNVQTNFTEDSNPSNNNLPMGQAA